MQNKVTTSSWKIVALLLLISSILIIVFNSRSTHQGSYPKLTNQPTTKPTLKPTPQPYASHINYATENWLEFNESDIPFTFKYPPTLQYEKDEIHQKMYTFYTSSEISKTTGHPFVFYFNVFESGSDSDSWIPDDDRTMEIRDYSGKLWNISEPVAGLEYHTVYVFNVRLNGKSQYVYHQVGAQFINFVGRNYDELIIEDPNGWHSKPLAAEHLNFLKAFLSTVKVKN